MNENIRTPSDEELTRLRELAGVGASCAASAFGSILGQDVSAAAQQVVDADRYRADARWSTGVIFEAEGELSGLVAILLPPPLCDTVGALGVVEQDDASVESAVREFGNIVASHTISAIADALGGRILLSVPLLVTSDADHALVALAGSRGGQVCIECELANPAGQLYALLVFVPDPPSDEPAIG